jgi:hypothetical protein
MKSYKILLSIVAMSATAFFAACDKDSEGPNEEQRFLKKLAGEWTLTTGHVSVDGVEVSGSFAGMAIIFTPSKNYSVTNGIPPIWPTSGSFTLQPKGNSSFDILRDDGVLISISNLADQTVTLSFTYTFAGGRRKSISGDYEFVMNK